MNLPLPRRNRGGRRLPRTLSSDPVTKPRLTTVDGVTVGPFQENTYVLRRTEAPDVIIIDPGDEAERLVALVEDHGWRPRAIVNTHAHLDHMGAVQGLKERYGIPFYLHPDERSVLTAAPEHARLFGVREPAVPAVDAPLHDGLVLAVAGLELTVIHTPGHTPGGVSLQVDGRLFAGDTLFYGSVGRTDLPGGDWETLMRSLRERILVLPDETLVHSGHGPDTTVGRERRHNPFLAEGDVDEEP